MGSNLIHIVVSERCVERNSPVFSPPDAERASSARSAGLFCVAEKAFEPFNNYLSLGAPNQYSHVSLDPFSPLSLSLPASPSLGAALPCRI